MWCRLFIDVNCYLEAWSQVSCGPHGTSPQSTPGLAGKVARSSHPPRGVRVSLYSAHCWNPDPSAASIRSKCRTERPWRVQPIPAATVFQTDSLLPINPKCYPRRGLLYSFPHKPSTKSRIIMIKRRGFVYRFLVQPTVSTVCRLQSASVLFAAFLPNQEPKESTFTCQIHCLTFFLLPTTSISNPYCVSLMCVFRNSD